MVTGLGVAKSSIRVYTNDRNLETLVRLLALVLGGAHRLGIGQQDSLLRMYRKAVKVVMMVLEGMILFPEASWSPRCWSRLAGGWQR